MSCKYASVDIKSCQYSPRPLSSQKLEPIQVQVQSNNDNNIDFKELIDLFDTPILIAH